MNKKTIISLICVFILICVLSITVSATSSTTTSYHNVNNSTQLQSGTACSSLGWITANYNWVKGSIFAPDKCTVFMQTAGITSGQTNAVTVSIWHDGQIYDTDTQSSAKISVSYTLNGRLWSAVEKVQADYDASYEALGNQHWTVIGN